MSSIQSRVAVQGQISVPAEVRRQLGAGPGSVLVRDDVAQVAAAEAFIADGAWVSQLVLAETIWVLDAVHERNAAQLAAAIEMLLNHERLTIQEADVVKRSLEHFRARPALGFSDCLVLDVARKAGHVPLETFGRALSKLEGTQRVQ
jgi:predicted nucleic-acid-binding protein